MIGNPDWLLIGVGAVVLSAPGLFLLFIPVETLLKLDPRTEYWIYRRAPDHETGIRRARVFYRCFGAILIFFVAHNPRIWTLAMCV